MIKKLELPEELNLNIFRKTRNKPPGRSNIVLSCNDARHLPAARVRILKLNVPGLSDDVTDSERTCFLSSLLPLEQELVVHSLANLLEYVEAHFKHLFYRNSLVVSCIVPHHVENQMLVDLTTLLGLQIFTTGYTMSNRKKYNLYNLLNQCHSHTGMTELREIMMQPRRDIAELEYRQRTVEWCCRPSSFEVVTEVRSYLRKIRNLSLLFTKIVLHLGKPVDIKSFKKSVFNAFLICQKCCQLAPDDIEGTILKPLAESMVQSKTIKQVLCSIEWVVDLEAGEKDNRFIVKRGVDADLDAKRALMESIRDDVSNATKDVTQLQAPGYVNDFYIAFMPGMGFLVAAELHNPNQNVSLNTTKGDSIEILYRSESVIYFQTPFCQELNLKYGNLHGDIGLHETRIFDRLIKFINESLPEMTTINKLCGKLDCMISFASVAMQRGYVKPELTMEKCICIDQGRHPLIEIKAKFVPSNTNFGGSQKKLMTILTAPNAFGKSVYMKQVAILCYMAHLGSFISAKSAKIGVLDSIYSRIYCPESVEQGCSSYMSDVSQMSKVILHSTNRSLVLIDEFGKGTNIREGQALLASCLLELISREELAPLTIVTTHYLDVLKVIGENQLISLKTIKSVENDVKSTYQVIDGVNTDGMMSDYKEVSEFIGVIMGRNALAQ